MFTRANTAIQKYGVTGVVLNMKDSIKIVCFSNYYNIKAICRLFLEKNQYPWRINSVARIGYATRSIAKITINNISAVVTADVGDGTLSIVPVDSNEMQKRSVVVLPKLSAPVGVCAHNNHLFIALFNFDENHLEVKETGFYRLTFSESKNKIVEVPNTRKKIKSRAGSWGYRCSSKLLTIHYLYVATVDRTLGTVHFFMFDPSGDTQLNQFNYDLGEAAEPINISMKESNNEIEAVISLRGTSQVVILKIKDAKVYSKYVLPTDGRSRSSVAFGQFWPNEKGFAVALWGGEPTDLKSVVTGKLQVFKKTDANKYISYQTTSAGIHPTDVITGDFDGDGVDEIAVLNYGAGLSPLDRIHPGSIQIFKVKDNKLTKIEEVKVPYPRIGKKVRSCKGIKDALLVTLFFENRLIFLDRESDS